MPNDATVEMTGRASAVPERQPTSPVRAWISRNTATLLVVAVFGATFGGAFGLVATHMSSVDTRFGTVNSRFNSMDARFEVLNGKIDALPKKEDIATVKEAVDGIGNDIGEVNKRLLSIEESLRDSSGSGGQQE